MNEKDLKHHQFEQYKSDLYQTFGQTPMTLFKFFYENNEIFQQINDEDMNELHRMHLNYIIRGNSYVFGSFLSVLLIDQVFFRLALPKFRINRLRLPLNIAKYIGIPLLAWKFFDVYRGKDIEKTFEENMQKYNFNYEDYNRVMGIFERPYNVGRMKEFMEKKEKFDWNGVPE